MMDTRNKFKNTKPKYNMYNNYAVKSVVSMKVEAHISRSLSMINGIAAAVTFEVFFLKSFLEKQKHNICITPTENSW